MGGFQKSNIWVMVWTLGVPSQLTSMRILLKYLNKEKEEAQCGQWYQERIKKQRKNLGALAGKV